MNEYSKKILKVPTVTFVREQDQGKQPVWITSISPSAPPRFPA